MTTDLRALIERLESGETGRRLDQAVDGALNDFSEPLLAPAITTSLDAAVAFVERVLPGWDWEVWNRRYGGGLGDHACVAAVRPGRGIRSGTSIAHGEQAAAALVAAALKALEASRG